jgi:DnaJ-class molecular chaperone
VTCPRCHGTRRVLTDGYPQTCGLCRGAGTVTTEQELEEAGQRSLLDLLGEEEK